MAVLGEVAKAVPISSQRIRSIEPSATYDGGETASTRIELIGSQGEEVTIAVWTGSTVETHTVVIDASGNATVHASA
jgi:hypothetical protein